MRGFSLVEMLLSIAIIGIIAGVSAPVYFSYQDSNGFISAADSGVRTLRRAQLLAANMDRDSNWGVNFATSSITLYAGSSYASRDSGYDERFDLPSTMTSTAADINFSKFSGEPAAAASVVLRSDRGQSRAISINEKGTVDY